MSHRSSIIMAVLSFPLLTAAACDPGPASGQSVQPASSGGLTHQPVSGSFTRYTRRSATDDWTFQVRGTPPKGLTLSTTWCASPGATLPEDEVGDRAAPLLAAEHASEMLLERNGALRCRARVRGLDDALGTDATATVRFVRDELAGRLHGALSVVGWDRLQNVEVKLVFEFAAEGAE